MEALQSSAVVLYDQLTDERFSGVCRCCLSAGNFLSMYCRCSIEDTKEDYFDAILTCFNVNLVDVDGNRENELYLVCDECITRLKNSYTFKCQIIDAQKSFQEIVTLERSAANDDLVMDYEIHSNKLELSSQYDIKFELRKDTQAGYASLSQSDADDNTPLAQVPKLRIRKRKAKHLRRLASSPPPDKQALVKKRTNAQIDREVLESLDQDKLQCRICNEVFHNSYLLRTHVNIHYPNHICEICGKGHATQNRLRNHQRTHIMGNFICTDCGQVFFTKGKFDNHRGKHILPLRHICPRCPDRFSSYYQRQKHLESAHNEVLKRYTCDLCPKDFTTSGSLFNHKKRNHFKLKSHVCSKCEKAFYHKSELNDHMVVHTKERKFLCSVCMKMYPRACTLREHMKIHNNVKKHICSECNRAFTQKCTLRGHMKVHQKTYVKISVVKDE